MSIQSLRVSPLDREDQFSARKNRWQSNQTWGKVVISVPKESQSSLWRKHSQSFITYILNIHATVIERVPNDIHINAKKSPQQWMLRIFCSRNVTPTLKARGPDKIYQQVLTHICRLIRYSRPRRSARRGVMMKNSSLSAPIWIVWMSKQGTVEIHLDQICNLWKRCEVMVWSCDIGQVATKQFESLNMTDVM